MKKIYEEKAFIDRKCFLSIVEELSPHSLDKITDEELRNFTKNYLSLTSITYRTLEQEFEKIN